MANLNPAEFESIVARERAASGTGTAIVVPLTLRLIADQLTPTIAYRRLVAPDDRAAPSFLLESVEGGERQGRYSILGAQPILHVTAKIGAVNLNPTWTVPTSIIKNEIIPKMRKDPAYLAGSKIRILDARVTTIDPRSINWGSEKAVNYTLR